MEKLYQKSLVIGRLREYFAPYLSLLTKPSAHKMFLLLLAMLTMQTAVSIKFLYEWFINRICSTSLNAYYYLLSYTEIPLNKFMQVTVRLSLSLIPGELAGLPILLMIDDTMQAKYGTHFECYSTMFDHAKHNGSNYLKGHCFVAIAIGVPVIVGEAIQYLHVPVGHRLRNDESKLKIASALIDLAMEELTSCEMIVLLCDSWYPKGDVIKTVKKHDNLELIANVRVDTNIFELPPKRTGKPGRPAQRGRELSIYADFDFIRAGDYFVAVRTVLTNLFGNFLPIYLTVTTPDILNHKAYRVFISTAQPRQLQQQYKGYEKKLSDSLSGQVLWLLPLFVYSFRWSIEVIFYEQKTFWSFGLYRIRSKSGIENFVNFSSLCYACMKILPLMDNRFAAFVPESAQFRKLYIGEAIRHELFLWQFEAKHETGFNSDSLWSSILCRRPVSKSMSA